MKRRNILLNFLLIFSILLNFLNAQTDEDFSKLSRVHSTYKGLMITITPGWDELIHYYYSKKGSKDPMIDASDILDELETRFTEMVDKFYENRNYENLPPCLWQALDRFFHELKEENGEQLLIIWKIKSCETYDDVINQLNCNPNNQLKCHK